MHPLRSTRQFALAGFQWFESRLDRVFGSSRNPLRQLGALGFMLFWLLAISGIYLYAVLDTSAEGAYRSIDQLSRQQWYLGGVLRSVHRYAADGFIVVMLLHLMREALLGRYSGFRRFSWLTGVALVPLALVSAIGGFWLNWDQLGQFSALATAELLDYLPVFASPLTRNFLDAAAVSDRLFSLFIFVHLGVPLLLIFGLWFHIQRLAHAAIFPPRPMAIGVATCLLALALAAPVLSHPPADMALAPNNLALDWFLLFIHPLGYASSPGLVWTVLLAALALLLLLPLLPQPAPPPVAVVDPANCNGCRRCFEILFWGGGHALQFTWTLLMLVAWLALASASGARLLISPRITVLMFVLALVAVFVTPYAYLAYDIASVEHRELLTWAMRLGGGLAIVPIALAVVLALAGALPADDSTRPLRAALVWSIVLFASGGVIGIFIHGSNVRIPAHYHGCIVGVTLAMMGLAYHLLPRLGYARPAGRTAAWQPGLYGVGQLMHITGLVWSGGYGVQRKVAGAEQVLRSTGEIAGMGLMGLGGLIAIVGGLLFVVVMLRAMRRVRPDGCTVPGAA